MQSCRANLQVGVVQFSNDCKVEVQPAAIDLVAFRAAIGDMVSLRLMLRLPALGGCAA
jgi:hypothetical protein